MELEKENNLVIGQIIQDISKPELWFLLIIYCHIIIHIPTVSLKYFKGLRHYGVKENSLNNYFASG